MNRFLGRRSALAAAVCLLPAVVAAAAAPNGLRYWICTEGYYPQQL